MNKCPKNEEFIVKAENDGTRTCLTYLWFTIPTDRGRIENYKTWEIGETGKRIWLKPRLVKTFCQFDSDISYQPVRVSVQIRSGLLHTLREQHKNAVKFAARAE